MNQDFNGPIVDIAVGPILALRSFRLADDGSLLPITDAGRGRAWEDGENVARCSVTDHPSPSKTCGCGFYAYGFPEWVDRGDYAEHNSIQAVIECYGTVIAGEKGLRCGKAKIVAISAPLMPPEYVDMVRGRYPSVRQYQSVDEMLASHPLTVLDTYQTDRRRPLVTLTVLSFLFPIVASLLTLLNLKAFAMIFMVAAFMYGLQSVVRSPQARTAPSQSARASLGLLIVSFVVSTVFLFMAHGVQGQGYFLGIILTLTLTQTPLWARLTNALFKAHPLRRKRSMPISVRRMPLSALILSGLDFSAIPDEPWLRDHRIMHGQWVTHLPTPQGKVAFVQTFGSDPATSFHDLAQALLSDRSLTGVIMSGDDEFVRVAFQECTQGLILLGQPMPLSEVADHLGLPGRLWCPPTLRQEAVSYLLTPCLAPTLPKSLIREGGVADLMLEFAPAREVLARAVFLCAREDYRAARAIEARVGVEPLVSARLPEVVQAPSAEMERRGWAALLNLSGGIAEKVADLYTRTRTWFPHTRFTHENGPSFSHESEALQWLENQGFTLAPVKAHHYLMKGGGLTPLGFHRAHDLTCATIVHFPSGTWRIKTAAVILDSPEN